LNCAKGHATTIDIIQKSAQDNQCFALLLQEPWVEKDNTPPQHPLFNSYFPSNKPKCVIYTKKNIIAHPTFMYKDSYIGLKINLENNSQFTLYNFYSPGVSRSFSDLITTTGFIPNTSSIIMGDFNSHHPWWGAHLHVHKRRLEHDNIIANWFNIHKYTLHNTPGIPTFFSFRNTKLSVLDLALSNGKIGQKVISWECNKNTTSDHALCSLFLNISPLINITPKLNWRRANWTQFQQDIKDSTKDLLRNPLDLGITKDHSLERVESFLDQIQLAIDKNVPLKSKQSHLAPWWNHNLTILKHQATTATRRARQSDDVNLRKDASDKRKKLNLCLKNTKMMYWSKQLEMTNTTNVWKTIRNKQTHRQPIPPLRGKSAFKDKCNLLRNTLFPTPKDLQDLPQNFVTSKSDISNEFFLTTPEEVSLHIKAARKLAAVGADKINYSVIENIQQADPEILPRIFNELYITGAHPKSWKHATCVVIHKKGGKPPDEPGSYRPISLQSCLGKLQESITASRIANCAIRCGAISHTQMGGQQYNSANDAMIALLDHIGPSLYQPKQPNKYPRKYSSILTHDIKGAFNNTHPKLLCQIMEQRNMPYYLTQWTRNFTSDRTLSFSFDSENEDPQPCKTGLPQGSPVSPILFLIYAHALLERNIHPLEELDLSYIDDVLQVQNNQIAKYAVGNLQQRTESQLHRATLLNLTFAQNKSEMLHTIPLKSPQKYKDINASITLSYNDTCNQTVTIESSNSITYLGVIFDESLTFTTHARMAASNGMQALSSMRYLRKSSWGIPSKIAHHLTFAAILPRMLWASPTWWNQKSTVLDALKLTYNVIARWITGLPRNTRNTKLLQAAHLPPLNLYLDYLSSRYAVRTLFLPNTHFLTLNDPPVINNKSITTPGRHFLGALISNINIHPLEDRKTPNTGQILQLNPIHITKNDSEKDIHQQWIKSLPHKSLVIYTDGSKMQDGNTGAGWVIHIKATTKLHQIAQGYCNIGTRSEVYDAELHAVEESLEAVKTLDLDQPTHRQIFIMVDNQAAIDCLMDNKSNSQYARIAIQHKSKLEILGWEIKTGWVPSHTGIEGNEIADKLAKLGATHNIKCRHTTTTKTWMMAETRRIFFRSWSMALPNPYQPSFKYPTELANLKWKTSKALAGVQCSRTPCDPRIGIDDEEKCVCDQDILTSKHLIQSCPLLQAERTKWFSQCTGLPTDEGFLFNLKNIPSILKFMADTGVGYAKNPLARATISVQQSPDKSSDEDDMPAFMGGGVTMDDEEEE
jgi:ribonuclease HI